MSLLLCQKKINPKVFLLGLSIVIILFSPKILNGVDPNKLLKAGSRNVVSAIAINQVLLYYAISYAQKKTIFFLPALINMIFCLLCIGRSGIIVSLLIFAGVFCYCFINYSRMQKGLVILIFIFLLLIFKDRIKNLISTMAFVENFNKRGLVSGGRDTIAAEYYRIINENPWDLLFGVRNIKSNNVFRIWRGNLHNSFFTLHTYYSLFGVMIVALLSVVGIFSSYAKHNFFIPWLLICVYIRVSKDIMAFPGFIDPVIFFCIFLSFSNCINKKNSITFGSIKI